MNPQFLRAREAVDRGAVEVLQQIIAEGDFDPHDAESHGRTLLMFAVLPLSSTSTSSSLEIIGMLLETGADPNQTDNEGWSAVHLAARSNFDALRVLLAGGGDPHKPDPYGNNPVSIATFSGRNDNSRVKLLINAGADPNLKNKYGVSALDVAKRMGDSELVSLLTNRSIG